MSKFVCMLTAALVLHVIAAARSVCPAESNCICGGTIATELKCNIDGRSIHLNLFPNTYLHIKCENTSTINYDRLPELHANDIDTLKSVTFKDCPLPSTSFRAVLTRLGVKRTMSLIFQNGKKLSSYMDRKHFEGLQDLTKLLLSVSAATRLPDNLFTDMQNLTWLNIRSNGNNLSENLFKPLEKLETLEISHNERTNFSANMFSHLSLLRKLSLWQSNVTRFSEDLFNGVEVLEELDLSSNGLNELPPSIFNPLKKLKKLTLFSNKFSSLPQDLFKHNEELDTVIIFNNNVKLKALPKGLFKGKKNLTEVYVQRCALETVPQDVFSNSSRLTNISLAYNEIEILPESVFNDQINLLDLDLSHNELKKLEPKIFSSLVRLEQLKLSYNSLEIISGSTFSSLLSLVYLDMENNILKTISSYMFPFNKQKISINLAYNMLNFEQESKDNLSLKYISPFVFTYNMRLLNLSHNQFKVTFDDWWFNSHERLDISFNEIEDILSPNMTSVFISSEVAGSDAFYLNKSKNDNAFINTIKELNIEGNPLACTCDAIKFVVKLAQGPITCAKGATFDILQDCNSLKKFFCDRSNWNLQVFLAPFFIGFVSFILFSIFLFRRHVYDKVKKKIYHYLGIVPQEKLYVITYCDMDEAFVVKEFIPKFIHEEVLIHLNPISLETKDKSLNVSFKETFPNYSKTVVVFTSNYLTTVYSDVNIKKIKSILTNQRKTYYVCVDIGPENSVYTYLKYRVLERKRMKAIHWEEIGFWYILFSMLKITRDFNKDYALIDLMVETGRGDEDVKLDMKFKKKALTNEITDITNICVLNSLAQSQV